MRSSNKWKPIQVMKDGIVLTGYLHPIGSVGNNKYWAFSCLKAGVRRVSLKVRTLAEARQLAANWFEHADHRQAPTEPVHHLLTWEDWDAIQEAHSLKRSQRNETRAKRTLEECRKANRLFLSIVNASSASAVTPDLVERFQVECPRRHSKFGRRYSRTTVQKTLAHLSASFNRCNRGAGKKCIRGIVAAEKLLESNPFEQVQWVEQDHEVGRHFTIDELKALLNWKHLAHCPIVGLFAKVSLWTCGRLEEMTKLQWDWIDHDGYITIPNDVAKWRQGRTARIPLPLLGEITANRSGEPHVWAGYVSQLKAYHRSTGHHASAHKVADFAPQRLRILFQKWIREWCEDYKIAGLSHHAFRRTGLQWSRDSQLRRAEADYATAANVGLDVANKHYTNRPDRLWADVTYQNIARRVVEDPELATLLGCPMGACERPPTVEEIQDALGRGDLAEATRLLGLLQS